MRAVVLLLEGQTEEILYYTLLKRVYKAQEANCAETPEKLRDLLEPLGRRKCLKVRQVYVAMCNCSGVENIKETLKLLLKRRELAEALRDTAIHIVIAADRDERPAQAIKDMLQSLGYTPAESGGTTVIPPLGLPIHVIEQGGREDTATGQIEDDLLKLVELVHPDLTQAAARLEEAHGALDNKQKLLLYLALLNRRPGIRKLYKAVKRLLKNADETALRQALKNIVEQLDKLTAA
ncbi:hypothetical protein Tneu_0498 [Pyrobaculum neutrophilum V24Sta]|uniref:Uncharacterized protein n=2 Tax=Pyrobaculum neutrophilum TaxID=70771 RepID=B1YCD0_PYRNV|nr:hypothetical protein Tneu_0498 [Pyrobaculum neutrophilum V24Sta]